ncbi:MAG: hypothetical protein U0521_15455 [Anaerolineae bacterium]
MPPTARAARSSSSPTASTPRAAASTGRRTARASPVRRGAAAEWDLFTLQGGVETNLTRVTGEDDKTRRWSPDGSRIAFNSVRDSARWADIFVIDAEGTRLLNLTADGDDDREPVLVAGSVEIVFRSFRDGNCDLYARCRSRAARQLAHRPAHLGRLARLVAGWSPGSPSRPTPRWRLRNLPDGQQRREPRN